MHDLRKLIAPLDPPKEFVAEGAVLPCGAVLPLEKELLAALNNITTTSIRSLRAATERPSRHDQLRRGRKGHRSDGADAG
jgi:hypothetical protein